MKVQGRLRQQQSQQKMTRLQLQHRLMHTAPVLGFEPPSNSRLKKTQRRRSLNRQSHEKTTRTLETLLRLRRRVMTRCHGRHVLNVYFSLGSGLNLTLI